MRLKIKSHSTGTPNMIPTIDILFQLVIFFVLACRFAVVEQFPVPVPDKCASAKPQPEDQRNIVTVTVMKAADSEGIECAVGAEKLPEAQGRELAIRITEKLNEKLGTSGDITVGATSGRPLSRIVCLRIAKDVPFGQSQYALAAVAASSATDIQMAVLKN
jgi:biopolymer transport protein ExbD